MAVLLFSNMTGYSFAKAISILKQAGSTPSSLERILFITANVIAYSPTRRDSDGQISWNVQRDQTRYLTEFEMIGFRDTWKIFFTPLDLMETFDDDLFGSKASENQIKMSSARKADKEGHSAHAIADALFRLILVTRFRRRGEAQTEPVGKCWCFYCMEEGERQWMDILLRQTDGMGKRFS